MTPPPIHTHTPKTACEHEDLKVLRYPGEHTNREGIANRPDMIMKDTKEKTCILIDVAISADRIVTHRKQERNQIQGFMYTANVEHEMCHYTKSNWSHRSITKVLKKNLQAIPGKHSVDSIQKTAERHTKYG
jgi:hypothetical protein